MLDHRRVGVADSARHHVAGQRDYTAFFVADDSVQLIPQTWVAARNDVKKLVIKKPFQALGGLARGAPGQDDARAPGVRGGALVFAGGLDEGDALGEVLSELGQLRLGRRDHFAQLGLVGGVPLKRLVLDELNILLGLNRSGLFGFCRTFKRAEAFDINIPLGQVRFSFGNGGKVYGATIGQG